MNEAVFKADVWDGLPKKLQQKIKAAATYSALLTGLNLGVADIAAVEKLMKGRNEWVTLDDEAQRKIEELGRAWSQAQAKAQTAKGNPWMARVSESYWGFYDRWKKYGVYRHN